MRLALGVAIIAVLIARLGAGPFVDGLQMTNAWALAAAVAITAATTLCCAWRWRVVSGALGATLSLRSAVGAYYRSQFLNATLPGGVLGDVHRAVGPDRRIDELGRSLRSVVWERCLGQVVQVLLTVALLLVLASPVPTTVLILLALGTLALLATGFLIRATGEDLRRVLRPARTRLVIVVSSVLAVIGHVVTLLIAIRAAGVTTPIAHLLPLTLIVLLGSALPTNVAGWGPREGTAAWAFGAAGLTASQGVSSAVVYGVMVLVATLPGAVLLLVGRRRRPHRSRTLEVPAPLRQAAAHG